MYDTKIISKAVDLRNQGFTQKEIAIQLGCGERTVRRWFTGVNLQNLKIVNTEEIEFDFDKLNYLFSKDLVTQIMFCISMGYKNNLPLTVSFLNNIEDCYKSMTKISEPWLAAISGFGLLADLTGVKKFKEIENIINSEKPFNLDVDRKKYKRRINHIVTDLRFELIGLFDISNFSEKDFLQIQSGKKSNKQFDNHIYISNLKISGSDEEINNFLNSKYGLLLEIESRLPDLDQLNKNLSVSRYKKTPLTLILLKLFLLP